MAVGIGGGPVVVHRGGHPPRRLETETHDAIRAALNEIFDYGRPSSITLVCLVDRSGRELPIQADIIGQHLQLAPEQHIKLNGPEPLEFVIT